MAEDKNKKVETELSDELLDEVSGGHATIDENRETGHMQPSETLYILNLEETVNVKTSHIKARTNPIAASLICAIFTKMLCHFYKSVIFALSIVN